MAKGARNKSHRAPVQVGGLINDSDGTTPVVPAKPAPDQQTATPRRVNDGVHRTSVYIPNEVHDVIRRIAFDLSTRERRVKEHDLIMQGLELVLNKHGFPPFSELIKK